MFFFWLLRRDHTAMCSVKKKIKYSLTSEFQFNQFYMNIFFVFSLGLYIVHDFTFIINFIIHEISIHILMK